MTSAVLVPSHTFLVAAAKAFFVEQYENPTIRENDSIHKDLGWKPNLHFLANDHLIVAAEVSESPYPLILRMRHADLTNLPLPIAVYCICPEEAYLNVDVQADVRELQSHGFGLITVDQAGAATRRFPCIPLVQHIPEAEFRAEIEPLPKRLRVRLREAFEKYRTDPVSGLQDLSEVMEGLVQCAAKRAAARGWASESITAASPADILDELAAMKECKSARASIGGVRSFVKEHRNPSHHFPKDKAQAHQKYRSAQHGFREGLKQIRSFRSSFKALGVNIRV